MEKFKINWIEQKTGKSGKSYWVMHLLDSTGKETQNVSTFEDKYQAGMEIEGQIVQNGNYLNWKPLLEKPNFMKTGFAEKKKTDILEMQGNKAKQIEEAQDRSAWMWAKNNASTLLASAGQLSNCTMEEMAKQVIHLATKIYNGEPLEPFN